MFKHLAEKNIGYIAHLMQAWNISIQMLIGSISCFIHGIYPDVFDTTATDIAYDITYTRMNE